MPPKVLPSFMNTQVKLKTPSKVDLSSHNKSPLKSRAGSPNTIQGGSDQSTNSSSGALVTPLRQQVASSSGGRSIFKRNIVIILIVITTLFCVFFSPFELWYNDYLTSSHSSTVSVDPELFKVALANSHIEEAAFVFTAFGSTGNKMRCSAAVETLVRHAGWDGDVYIVYENEACFDANRIIQESGIRRERLHLVKFTPALTPSLRAENPAESDSIVDPMIEHLYIPNIRTEWRVKSRIFDIVTDPKIKIVASVDCDTLFAIEGCASALVSKAVDWKPTDAQIKFTSLESHSVGNTTHVNLGTFLVHREHSKEALRLWAESVEQGRYSYLTAMDLVEQRLKPGEVNPMSVTLVTTTSSATPLSSPQAWSEVAFERNDIYHKIACINHISEDTCSSLGRENFQKFANKFGLKSYSKTNQADSYRYCYHPAAKLFLESTWIPFHWLPYCPKIDQLF